MVWTQDPHGGEEGPGDPWEGTIPFHGPSTPCSTSFVRGKESWCGMGFRCVRRGMDVDPSTKGMTPNQSISRGGTRCKSGSPCRPFVAAF